jgi:hypothetical protein
MFIDFEVFEVLETFAEKFVQMNQYYLNWM